MEYIEEIKEKLKLKNPLYIKVKVMASMPKTEITAKLDDGTYKVRVKSIPVKGASNEDLCKFLKKSLEARDVAIVSGGRDKIKLIRISL